MRVRNRWTEERAKLVETLYNQGDSTKKIAEATGMSVRAVQKFIELHISETEGAPWYPWQPPKLPQRGKAAQRNEALFELVAKDGLRTHAELNEALPIDLRACPSTICRAMRKMKITRKRARKIPEKRNTPETIRARKVYAMQMSRKHNSQLFFLDETGTDLHNHSKYGYSVEGMPVIVPVSSSKGPNNSIIGCMGADGFFFWKKKVGAYNSEHYSDFLSELLPLLPDDAILIMDNAAFHKSEPAQLQYAEHSTEVRYLPPYSPQLNPIELFWHSLKVEISKHRPIPKTQIELETAIDQAMEKARSKPFDGYFKDMRDWLRVAMAGEPFNN